MEEREKQGKLIVKVSNFILSRGSDVKGISFVIIYGILAISFLFSCSKGPVEPEEAVEPEHPLVAIVGSWNWQSTCGGIAGNCVTADSIDFIRSISFDANYNYSSWLNDSLVSIHNYRIVRKLIKGWRSDTLDVLVIDGGIGFWGTGLVIQFNGNDSLGLAEPCPDCFGHLYLRRSDN